MSVIKNGSAYPEVFKKRVVEDFLRKTKNGKRYTYTQAAKDNNISIFALHSWIYAITDKRKYIHISMKDDNIIYKGITYVPQYKVK